MALFVSSGILQVHMVHIRRAYPYLLDVICINVAYANMHLKVLATPRIGPAQNMGNTERLFWFCLLIILF